MSGKAGLLRECFIPCVGSIIQKTGNIFVKGRAFFTVEGMLHSYYGDIVISCVLMLSWLDVLPTG